MAPSFEADPSVPVFAAKPSAIVLKFFLLSSERILKDAQRLWSAGIGLVLHQPPSAYWKKSFPGLTVVSRSAALTPTPFFASAGLQPVDVIAAAEAQTMDNTRIRFI